MTRKNFLTKLLQGAGFFSIFGALLPFASKAENKLTASDKSDGEDFLTPVDLQPQYVAGIDQYSDTGDGLINETWSHVVAKSIPKKTRRGYTYFQFSIKYSPTLSKPLPNMFDLFVCNGTLYRISDVGRATYNAMPVNLSGAQVIKEKDEIVFGPLRILMFLNIQYNSRMEQDSTYKKYDYDE